ncbi:Gfo/Idh/MocA family protein [Brevifollis gellanilyticus]|uniref:3-chlorobenzoate-3,4-dioxygenase dehydrogenase n=1 Tax=Brevifollis gellanilyticus TaxID=748831 RepID=A0A512MA40_9BACT|nr:Gfo/Idh/MocA family oxidoreductase [Brevifollis gellanilyticus]GEP43605.1 3-chlorobenzoate-3,4-dioxygenase dehydrogenase [Brevifollis gellanilyticus]
MNRRHFIAATASSLALASHAEPARKWRVVVVGNKGSYGHSLDTMWLKVPSTEIVAAADPDAKKLEATLKELNITQGFADYHDIAKAKPDLVAIGPAMGLHRDMVLAAAASGARGIYLEKPFCRNLAEADEIIAACEKHGVKLALAHRNRWHPTLPLVKKLVEEGAIGRLLELRGRGKEDRRGGMEDLWILGSHVLNLGVFLAGKPQSCSALVKLNGKLVTPADVNRGRADYGPIAGNEVHARFDMKSGVPFYFDSMQEAGDPKVGFGLQLIGTKGIIDIRVDQTPLAHFLPGNQFQPNNEPRTWVPISAAGIGKAEPVAEIGKQVMSHTAGALDLIASIEENRQPQCSAVDGRVTVEMITAVLASHVRQGASVSFPLDIRDNPLADWK